MNTTHLKIIMPDGLFFEGDVEIVTTRTTEGEIGLIHGHSPLVASLTIADLYIGSKKDGRACAVAGGLVYVTTESVSIITDAIEDREHIDLARAERARREAENKLRTKLDTAEEIRVKFALERAINRINVKKGSF